MVKRLAVTVFVSAVLGVGLWFLLTNAHIDIFPCVKTEYDFVAEKMGPPSEGLCSLRGVFNPIIIDGRTTDSQQLTAAGYTVYALVAAVVPLLIGLFVGRKVGGAQPSMQA